MRNVFLLKIITQSLLIFLFFLFFSPKFNLIFASHKVFKEDFNSYPNDSFPAGWVVTNDVAATSCSGEWKVHEGVLQREIPGGAACATNLMPTDEKWNNLGDNYVFELDMKFVAGIDHNVAFRFLPRSESFNDWYELHFGSPGDFDLSRVSKGKYNTFVVGNYPNRDDPYHLKIVVNENNIKIYIDNILTRDFTADNDNFPHGRIALRAGTGGEISITYFDNIVVTSIDKEPDLSVPLLKQTDSKWGSQVYDSANVWSPSSSGISAWGCALTSAAMAFQYHGIKKLPDGSDLDPGTLNTWLKNQPDGYVRTGWVNWLSLARLSKLAKSQNPDFSSDALEYSRTGGDKTRLSTDLYDFHPDILEEPGHFIVAKGVSGSTFLINDPYYERNDLSSYGNTFLSLGRYIPSATDLSYIMLVFDPSISLTVKDSKGNSQGAAFVESALTNDLLGSGTNGSPFNILYFQKPESGDYQISVSSGATSLYAFDVYLYDINGEVQKIKLEGSLSKDNLDSFVVSFNKQDSHSSSLLRIVTFQSTLADIDELRKLNLIMANAISQNLTAMIKGAQADVLKKRKLAALAKLKVFQAVLDSMRGTGIKEQAYKILLYDVTYLKNHL